MCCDTISESYSKKISRLLGVPRKAGLNGKGRSRPLSVFLGIQLALAVPACCRVFSWWIATKHREK